jgi:hypothetical protein
MLDWDVKNITNSNLTNIDENPSNNSTDNEKNLMN